MDNTLTIVREWVRASLPSPWSECAGLSPELRSWHLQFGNLSIDSDGRLWRRRAPPAMTIGGASWRVPGVHSAIS